MKKIFFSTTFLVIILLFVRQNSLSQTFPDIKVFGPLTSISENERDEENDAIKELKNTNAGTDSVSTEKPDVQESDQPSSTRIPINFGRAILEKYIK